MNQKNKLFSISLSQDEHATRIVVNLPTKIAQEGIQKAILLLTGGSVFWVSSHLPIVPLQELMPLSESQPAPIQIYTSPKAN